MAETPENNKTEVADEDEELSALLDSAVEDFDKVAKSDGNAVDTKSNDDAATKPSPPNTLDWSDDFMRNNRNLSSLFSPGPDGTFNMESLGQELQRLAEASTQAAGFETSPDAEFSSIIAQTLRNLSASTNDIQNQFSEEDLMNMLGSLSNMADGESEPGELMPFMQKMMQNLLSKEILHPALTSISEKYPNWIEENRGKVSDEEMTRYEKQYGKVKEVCAELEKEKPDDTEELKKSRFERVLFLMQEMQDCGQPPADLVGEMGPILDDVGQVQMPPGVSPDQCTLQ